MNPHIKTRSDYHDLMIPKPSLSGSRHRWIPPMTCLLLGFMLGTIYTKNDVISTNEPVAAIAETKLVEIKPTKLAAVAIVKKNQTVGKRSNKVSKV